jgi:DNA-binding transcriptional LysR family regulator
MELRSLRYFVVLAEELHFGRAARRLAITQPPLSIAIRNLENELDVQLLARDRRRVALTEPGRAFLDQARVVLARAADAVETARAAGRGEAGRLAIGFMSASIYTVLPRALREFAASHPGVRLELRELTLPEQFVALEKGDIHVGFVRPQPMEAEFSSAILMREPLVVALPAGHPLGRNRRVRAQALSREPFVMFQRSPGLVLHDIVLKFCLQQGFTPGVVQEASQTHAVVGLVSAGIGVALVPASAQEIRLRGVELRPLAEKPPQIGTALAWRSDNDSPALKAFVATARQVARLRRPASSRQAGARVAAHPPAPG